MGIILKIFLPFWGSSWPWTMSLADCITAGFIGLILIGFCGSSFRLLVKKVRINKEIKDFVASIDNEEFVNIPTLLKQWSSYRETFKYNVEKEEKTVEYAEDYFNEISILGSIFNVKLWRSLPGIFVGLGILGTFVGLTYGVVDFHTGSSEIIQKSISGLLGGMSTAFATSIWGMMVSILFNIIEKCSFRSVETKIFTLCEELNKKYKLSPVEEREILLREDREKLQFALKVALEDIFVLKEDDKVIYPAHSLRDLVRNAEEQSQALKSFSTDLADGIQLSIETIDALGNKMGDIFAHNVSSALGGLNEAVKVLREEKKASAGEFVEEVVKNLESSMKNMIDNFQSSLSSSTMKEIEGLVKVMASSASSLESLPDKMTETMSSFHSEVNEIQLQMNKASLDSGKQVSDCFAETMEKLEDSTKNLTGLIEVLSEGTEKTSEQVNTNAANAVEGIKESMLNGVKSINETVGQLIDREEKINEATGHLFETFSKTTRENSLMNDKLAKTISGFDTSIANIEGLSSKMLSSSDTLKIGYEKFDSSFAAFKDENQKCTQRITESLKQLQNSLDEAGKVSKNYTENFGVIQNGLKDIFAQIEKGLESYQSNARNAIEDYLSQMSEQLGNAVDSLSGAIDDMTDLTENLPKK